MVVRPDQRAGTGEGPSCAYDVFRQALQAAAKSVHCLSASWQPPEVACVHVNAVASGCDVAAAEQLGDGQVCIVV
jgi:hypothetical protein